MVSEPLAWEMAIGDHRFQVPGGVLSFGAASGTIDGVGCLAVVAAARRGVVGADRAVLVLPALGVRPGFPERLRIDEQPQWTRPGLF